MCPPHLGETSCPKAFNFLHTLRISSEHFTWFPVKIGETTSTPFNKLPSPFTFPPWIY